MVLTLLQKLGRMIGHCFTNKGPLLSMFFLSFVILGKGINAVGGKSFTRSALLVKTCIAFAQLFPNTKYQE